VAASEFAILYRVKARSEALSNVGVVHECGLSHFNSSYAVVDFHQGERRIYNHHWLESLD